MAQEQVGMKMAAMNYPGRESALRIVAFVTTVTIFVVATLAGLQRASGADANVPSPDRLLTCTVCHGVEGSNPGPLSPKLAGQKMSYLATQLERFRSGARKSETMAPIASTLTDDEIATLARYFSRQEVLAYEVDDPRMAALGKTIFFSGAPGAPACATCHGPGADGGAGMTRDSADAPNLGAQQADYIVGQLDAFARGERAEPVMGPAAHRLAQKDREAVAAYLSGLR